MRTWGNKEQVELLPSPPPATLRMDDDPIETDHAAETTALTIKGAARDPNETKRLTLLERLAKAKAEGSVSVNPPPIPSVATESELKTIKGRGIRARIQLKIKLETEKKQFRHNVNESKAQELRRMLLESKAKREAEETDLTLKRLDVLDRKMEVRRRLMVLKMMAAETDQERRARELREKLLARKREMRGDA
jgi:E3 ubiquitin-protein ligase Topors